jgi:hypothetical protein
MSPVQSVRRGLIQAALFVELIDANTPFIRPALIHGFKQVSRVPFVARIFEQQMTNKNRIME